MSRLVSFLILVAILVVIAVVFFRVMAGFFVPLFLAALLGVVVQPVYRWTLHRCRGYRYVAAGITTTLVLIAVLLPIGLVITTATMEGLSLVDQLRLANVRTKLDELRTQLGLEIPRGGDLRHIEARLRRWRDQQRQGVSPEVTTEAADNLLQRIDELEQWLAEQGPTAPRADAKFVREALIKLRDAKPDSVQQDEALAEVDAEYREFKRNLLGGTYRAFITELTNPTDEQLDQLRTRTLSTAGSVVSFGGDTLMLFGKLIFGIAIMVIALFFFLAEGSRMVDAIIRISPLEEQHVRELVTEFDRACRAIVSATLISAVVQGILAGVGFYVAGLRGSVALLMLLTMVLALVPFTGAAAVWIPVCLYLYFFKGSLVAAIALAVYGTIVISGSDNVIKPYVLSGQSNLHPLLALLSVLGGIQALGPIGILVGPMVVVFLQVLLKIVQREMSLMDKSSWFSWRGFGGWAPRPATAAATEAASAPVQDVINSPISPSDQLPVAPLASSPSGNGQASGEAPPKAPDLPKASGSGDLPGPTPKP
jgi:predicted PurR-regulated permease PerM